MPINMRMSKLNSPRVIYEPQRRGDELLKELLFEKE